MEFVVTDNYVFEKKGSWQADVQHGGIQLSTEKIRDSADTLSWLLRAWNAEDKTLRCFSLITALEQVIFGPSKGGALGKRYRNI